MVMNDYMTHKKHKVSTSRFYRYIMQSEDQALDLPQELV